MNNYIVQWYYIDIHGKVHQMYYRTFAESATEAVYDWETYHYLYYRKPWWKDCGVNTVSLVVDDWVKPSLPWRSN